MPLLSRFTVMLLEEKLAAALLERVGMRADITASKIQAELSRVPENERDSWVANLLASPAQSAEWQEFIEPFLIHETYLFRHEKQLEFLAKKILPDLIEDRIRSQNFEFRIWCAACSSGEEAYTAALLLKDALKQVREALKREWRLHVVGTDLSAGVLQKARKGEYSVSVGLNSFRDVPQSARHHFPNIFEHSEKTWIADETLRRTVTFQQRNVVSDPAPLSDVDLVMCRNVLIYLDAPSVERAITTMRGALRTGGVLVLGPADMLKHTEGWDMLTNEKAMFWKKSNSLG